MTILVKQGSKSDCVLIWNIEKNTERQTIDVGKNYEIVWDSNGYPYIVEGDLVYLSKQKCKINSFRTEDIQSLKEANKTFPDVNLGKGHRFDGLNHNWMIMTNHINMGFSFMQFVIKDKIEEQDSS